MQKLVIVHFRDTLAKYLPVVWVVNHHFFILKLEICQAYRSENDSKGFLVVKKKKNKDSKILQNSRTTNCEIQ